MSTLTTVKGTNRTLKENVPAEQPPSSEHYGRLRILWDKYVLATGDNFGTSGLIRLYNIPKKAKLHDAIFMTSDLGTTGVVDIGWAASSELDAGSAVVAADADGIFAAADCKTGTPVAIHMTGLTPGFGKTFEAEVEVQIDFTEASDGSGSRTLQLSSFIAVD